MNKFFSFQILTAMMFFAITGCNSDKPEAPDPTEPVEVKFQANLKQASLMKVAGDEFQASDEIGLFMKRAGQSLTAPGAVYPNGDNALLRMDDATGNFAAFPPLMYPLTGNVDFVAYYPYTTPVIGYSIPVDLSAETLYSNNAVERAPSEDPVALNFRYSLAKLYVTVSGGANSKLTPADFADMQVFVGEVYRFAYLQLADGTFADYGTETTFALNEAGSANNSAAFDALMLPRPASDGMVTFQFVVGAATYQYAYSPEYLGANLYQLNFILDFEAEPIVTLFSASISPRTVNEPETIYVPTYE